MYKVFFVEDEIVTREGIRDNVNWAAHGFEFCGEAPDGEMALPLLQALKPDVLITDIKMPFMDGLQLSQLVRARLPATKIVILSGHDEFDYAQRAIKLGVSEYLLKPITVQDMHNVLQRIASELQQEQREQRALADLREQAQANRAALIERFLLELATGTASPTEVLEKSQLLGIDLVAPCYLVTILRITSAGSAQRLDERERRQARLVTHTCVADNPDAFMVKKGGEEWVLVMKGDAPDALLTARDQIIARLDSAIQAMGCKLSIGAGAPHTRISDLHQALLEAFANPPAAASGRAAAPDDPFDKSELLKVDRTAIEDYLHFGTVAGFDAFYEALIGPLGTATLRSPVVNNYILMDIILAAAGLVNELDGNVYQIIPGLKHIETILADIETPGQLRDEVSNVLIGALVFRDKRANQQYAGVIRQAEDYIEHHFMDPNLSLNDVAAQVSLSPSHFSAVFSQETGQTFKEHLTEARIRKAKELLRTTTLRSSEISEQIGYNDPHYFSHVFRKHTGFTPRDFRWQAQEKVAEIGDSAA